MGFRWPNIRNVCIGAITAVGLLAFGLLLSARLYVTTENAQRLIQSQLNQLIPGRFSWSDCSLGLLDGRIELRDIYLQGASGEDLIRLDHLILELSWRDLLHGRIFAERLVLEKPRVWMRLDAENNLDLVDAFVAPGPSTTIETEPVETNGDLLPFNICVKTLQLSDGFYQFEMPDPNGAGGRGSAFLEHIDLNLTDGDFLAQRGRLRLAIGGGAVDMVGIRKRLDSLQLSTTLGENRFFPIKLSAKVGASVLQATGALSRLWTDPLLDVEIDLGLELVDIREALGLDMKLAGSLTARGTIKGRPADPKADLTLTATSGDVAGYPIDRMKLVCGLTERYLSVKRLDLSIPRGDVTLEGHLDLRKVFDRDFFTAPGSWDNLSYDGSLAQPETDLVTILGKEPGLRGILSSTLAFTGTGILPEKMSISADLEARGKQLTVTGVTTPVDARLTARASLDHGSVQIHQSRIQSGLNQLDLSGDLDLASRQLAARLHLSATDLGDMLPKAAGSVPKGALDLQVQMSGVVDRPAIVGRLQGSDLQYAAYSLGALEASFRLTDGIFRLDKAVLRNHRSEMVASGSMTLANSRTGAFLSDPLFDVSLSGQPVFLEDFVPGICGELTATGRFFGSIAHPEGELSVEGLELDLVGVQKIEAVHLTAQLSEGTIRISPLSVVMAPGEELQVDGRVSVDHTYSLQVQSNGIRLGRLDILRTKGIKNGETLYCDLSGAGSLDNPEISGTVGLRDLAINDNRIQDIRLGVTLQNRILNLITDDLVHLEGRLNLSTNDFSAALQLDRTDLAPFLRLVGRDDLEASIHGVLTCQGNITVPERIEASAALDKVTLGRAGTVLLTAENVKAGFQDGNFTIPGFHLLLAENGYLDVKGGGNLTGSMNLSATGEIPVAIVKVFTSEAPDDVAGTLRVQAMWQGGIDRPDFRIAIGLTDLALTIPDSMQKLHDVSGKIDITPAAVVLENIRGRLDTGNIQLDGKIELANLSPSRFEIKGSGHALPLAIPDMLETLVNAELVFSGTPEASSLTGEIVLLEGQYTKDVDLNLLDIIEPTRQEKVLPEPISLPYLNNLTFDVALRYRNPFMIDNNLALMALKPDLRLYGSITHPLISGRAEVESGTITYQKREFQVHKGVVDFVNPYQIEPTVDIDGSAVVRDWTIFLHISGTPDNLKYSLRSEPAESRSDILSLIVFGKTTRELVANESGQSSRPSQILADYIAKELQDNVKGATGLDTVSVEYQARQNEQDSPQVKVTVGKDLSRRVGLRYGVESRNGEFVQSTTAEYKFLERLMMSITQDNKGDYGAELNYRIEFR